jgi:hypothetical protein
VAPRKSSAKTAWPKPLADRIRATEQAPNAAGHPVTAEELARLFARAKPAHLQEILDSLVTLGRSHPQWGEFQRVAPWFAAVT